MKIIFNNVERKIDKTKIIEGLNVLADHAETMPGTDGVMIIDGVAYNVGGTAYTTNNSILTTGLVNYRTDATPFAPAVARIEEAIIAWGEGSDEPVVTYAAGLYETGSNYQNMIMSWDELIAEGIIDETGKIVSGQESRLAGNLVISDTLTSLPYRAFGGYLDEDIGEYGAPAGGCMNLTSVIIPNSVTSIGEDAFYNCTALTSVAIPDGVTRIGNSAFAYCTSLESITIPNSVTSIDYGAFYNCTSLESITIPDSVTSIGEDAFRDCTNLASITIPDSVTSIGDSAFFACSCLTSIAIPDGVTRIGNSVFYKCSSLESITIPDGVTNIGGSAFAYCTSIESITIPDSVTSIGTQAFRDCKLLADVYYTGTEEQWNAITIWSYNESLTGATIHYNYVPQ